LARGQKADVVGQNIAAPRYRQLFHHGQRRVGFEAGDDPALRGVELGPPRVIVIAEIKDIGGARFDRHLLGHGNVVDVGRAHRGVDRAVGISIVDDMHLGTADPRREPRPTGTVPIQPNAGGINQISGLGELAAQAAMSLPHQHRQHFGKYRHRPPRIGIRQGRAANRMRA